MIPGCGTTAAATVSGNGTNAEDTFATLQDVPISGTSTFHFGDSGLRLKASLPAGPLYPPQDPLPFLS